MRVIRHDIVDDAVIGIELTERNLRALLAKLEGNPPDSACTIEKEGFYVKAVPDFEHYGGFVEPGAMHPDTEAAMKHARLRKEDST